MRGAGLFIGGHTANKLPWFTHDHNARNDDFIQRSEDRFGPFGYSAWFKIIEVLHEHGTGDILKITKSRLARELRSRWPQVELYLNFSRTSGKLQFNCSSTEVELQIKKFRERQSKLKSNLPSTFRQPSVNLPQEREEERQREKHTPLPPKVGCPGFDEFWKAYPRKESKKDAIKAWTKLNPDATLQSQIMTALEVHKKTQKWTKDGGQYINLPAVWIRGEKWEDQVTPLVDPSEPVNMRDYLAARDRNENQIS